MESSPARRRGLVTRLVHEGEHAHSPACVPTSTPIYTSSTYLHPSAAALDEAFTTGQYVYGRYGNPTVATFERVMANAEGGVAAVAFASGMAALHAALLAAGTPRGETIPKSRGIVASRDLYGATLMLLHDFFAAQGVTVTYVDTSNLAALQTALTTHRPDVVMVEQISNPLLKVVDVESIAKAAHEIGARVVVDATMTTPILQQPLVFGADVVVHSATKFIGGHADGTAGIAVARSSMVADSLRRYSKLLGGVLGPFEANLMTRGVKTLALRVRQQCANAAAIATWLVEQPNVARVYYPGLASHPENELATRVFQGGFGAMVSFDLRLATRETAFRFVDALRMILPATTLGDIYTLVTLPLISSHRELTPEQRQTLGISDGLVRLSIGIEDVDDIRDDLQQALAAAHPA